MIHDQSLQDTKPAAFFRSRYAIGLIVVGAIAGCFLLSEHRARYLGALPFLLMLGCPLMLVFMRSGHGESHSGNHARHDSSEQAVSTRRHCRRARAEIAHEP